LPKDFWSKSTASPATPTTEKTQHFRKDSGEPAKSVSMFVPESIYPALPESHILPTARMEIPVASVSSPQPSIQSHWAPPDPAIQQVSWEHSRAELPQDFESLGMRLEELGATYYKAEKWGNRGELFRVSCFVAPSEAHTYEKHFQSIGSDVVTVMQTVIADIEKWKNNR